MTVSHDCNLLLTQQPISHCKCMAWYGIIYIIYTCISCVLVPLSVSSHLSPYFTHIHPVYTLTNICTMWWVYPYTICGRSSFVIYNNIILIIFIILYRVYMYVHLTWSIHVHGDETHRVRLLGFWDSLFGFGVIGSRGGRRLWWRWYSHSVITVIILSTCIYM